jgi:uncharacterized repeat protein (TIGR04138 family)
LIHSSVLFKNENDRREDFDDVFDLTQVMTGDYRIEVEEVGKWGSR